VAIVYVEVDEGNVDTWSQPLFHFARLLDLAQRCNAAAVAANKITMTYPSVAGIQEYVSRGDLVVVAHDEGVVKGYLICREDLVKGGCQAKWIGVVFLTPPQRMVDIYTSMGDIAIARYGWLWGRVTHPGIRNIMVSHSVAEKGLDGDDEIVVYDPLGNR
jgi:hypothetical protein